MATNAIGAGTINKPINAYTGWWEPIGKKASTENMSLGELARQLMEAGAAVKFPELAKQLQAAREEHLRLKHGLTCLLAGLICISVSMFGGPDMRRGRRVRDDFDFQTMEEVAA